MVIIEADGAKAALFVDALVGQQQVVIKSLEANYRKVAGVSGATIMGDGHVALILDVAVLAAMARNAMAAGRLTTGGEDNARPDPDKSSSGEDCAAAQEYLTFTLGDEEYAIDILKVQEIRGYEQPTTIANAPAFIKGVINLRGTIVPIVDLRIKFQVGKAEYTPFTVVIILNIGQRVVGIVVDGVSDVITMADEPDPSGAGVLGGGRYPLHPRAGHAGGTHADRDRHRAPDAVGRHGLDRRGGGGLNERTLAAAEWPVTWPAADTNRCMK